MNEIKTCFKRVDYDLSGLLYYIGYLLFWGNGAANGVRQIGLDGKAHRTPSLLIVDGQQRLTSLRAS